MAEETAPTEEELLAALDSIGVRDVLVQALATSVSIGYRRVSAEARDLPQARLAIEALRALEPVLRENGVDEPLVRDLEQARANLQLAYAAAVEAESQEQSSQAAETGRAETSGPGEPRSQAAESAPTDENASAAEDAHADDAPRDEESGSPDETGPAEGVSSGLR